MEALFGADELTHATQGTWLNGIHPQGSLGIYTDTRSPALHQMFLALAGENFDAHDFLSQAIQSRAGALCINRNRLDKLPDPCPIPVLVVEDTLTAYQNIAQLHRRRFPNLKLVAITGSVGKTSTKEILRAILETATPGKVLCTTGNTNNQVGVPQNLLRLSDQHKFAVIEMGTNHRGEIAPLSHTAEPNVALIGAIAPCHLEFLGSLEGIAEEKAHIFDGMSPDGVAVIPNQSPALDVLKNATKRFKTRYFGEDSTCDVSVRYLGGKLGGSRFELNFQTGATFSLEWSLTGQHQARNAAAAATVAVALRIHPEVIAAGIVNTKLPGMRSKITQINGVTYLNDAYNANPSSMRATLNNLREFADPSKLILVLGEMLELGENSRQEHQQLVADTIRDFPGAKILTIGNAYGQITGTLNFSQSPEARTTIEKIVRAGDLVFAKGSRGIKTELALPESAR